MQHTKQILTMSVLKYIKALPSAFDLTKPYEESVGYDMKSAQSYLIMPMKAQAIETGIKIQVPKGTYARLAPRSGLSFKRFTMLGAGVIDPDFTGCIKALIFNFGEEDLIINAGDRICQIVLEKYEKAELLEVESFDASETKRGEQGFGSSGIV